jgi:transposase-like protein
VTFEPSGLVEQRAEGAQTSDQTTISGQFLRGLAFGWNGTTEHWMVVMDPLVAQSFLLSAAARTLSLKAIYAEGEVSAYRRFCRLRWPDTDGAPICTACGCVDFYDLATRRRFKCAACHRQFSATSSTVFASRKLSFVDLLATVCLVVNASKGLSAVQLSRDLNVQHKTAFVLMHKLREAMSAETVDATLSGEVEVDGAAFGGHVRPANMREERLDRRLLANRSGKRRVVVALRQRGGRILTRTFIREAEAIEFAQRRITPGTIVSADEGPHWGLLEPSFEMRRITHADAYAGCGEGIRQKVQVPALVWSLRDR